MAESDPAKVAADIVAAFISNNSVPMSEVPVLIEAVHAAISAARGMAQVDAADVSPPIPAVSIRKSITPDYLICLDDGKRFKSLRRHLSQLGMTPEQYRAKWGLPLDYPMVAANYAAKRSEMAKNYGFGSKPAGVAAAPVEAGIKRRVGRPRKETAP